ncbi:hypothetical protein Tsubulata_049087, partial [Turnera subulata]
MLAKQGVVLCFQIGFLLLVEINHVARADAPVPIAKPGCPDYKCGDMYIPYPFGIGPKCYKDHWFDIECKRAISAAAAANNTTQLTAFIKSIKVEVVEFGVEYGDVIVQSPVISSSKCPSRRRRYRHDDHLNLAGTPFVFSTFNVFVAVGCNVDASMSQETSEQVGCKSPCSGNTTSIQYWRGDTFCTGRNCCLIPLQPYLQVYDPSLQSIVDGNETQEEGCKQLAFIASKDWLVGAVSDPSEVGQMDYVPIS